MQVLLPLASASAAAAAPPASVSTTAVPTSRSFAQGIAGTGQTDVAEAVAATATSAAAGEVEKSPGGLAGPDLSGASPRWQGWKKSLVGAAVGGALILVAVALG